MNTAIRQLDLALDPPSPWTGARLKARVARLSWRRIAGDLCLLLALASFAVMVVALRMSLYGQSVVASNVSMAVTLGAALAGVLLVVGKSQLHKRS